MILCFRAGVLWGCALETENSFKCRSCAVCSGEGCIGELPGMGGVNNSRNFMLNCRGWQVLRDKAADGGFLQEIRAVPVSRGNIRIGPVTGAEQNIGYAKEDDFYLPYFTAAYKSGIGICAGDGFPDIKLHLGLKAVETLQKDDASVKAAVFLKPYPDDKLCERIDWALPFAEAIGCDIDSYNIVTMRNLVHLEKKTPEQLSALRRRTHLPFAIKGIFCPEDIELVKQVKPDIAYISNHGGRIETREGSTADFLACYGNEIKRYCGQIWVDGGIRTQLDVQTALYYGAAQAVIVRPFIAALIAGGTDAMEKKIDDIADGC